jgi:hypothetical protein
MNQSDTNQNEQPKAVAASQRAKGVPTLRQALLIIAGTGAVGILIGLLPRF